MVRCLTCMTVELATVMHGAIAVSCLACSRARTSPWLAGDGIPAPTSGILCIEVGTWGNRSQTQIVFSDKRNKLYRVRRLFPLAKKTENRGGGTKKLHPCTHKSASLQNAHDALSGPLAAGRSFPHLDSPEWPSGPNRGLPWVFTAATPTSSRATPLQSAVVAGTCYSTNRVRSIRASLFWCACEHARTGVSRACVHEHTRTWGVWGGDIVNVTNRRNF